jgi:hypothetical protein
MEGIQQFNTRKTKDEAFRRLEKAYEQRASRLTELADPGFENLRDDSRFLALARLAGLP